MLDVLCIFIVDMGFGGISRFAGQFKVRHSYLPVTNGISDYDLE